MQPRVDDGAVGQRLVRVVMIRHHHLQPQLARQPHLLHRRHAAVHRHHQVVLLGQLPHRRHVQAVALLVPVGDVIPRVDADGAEVQQQQRGRRHAVGVVIAVDAHALLFLLRLPDAPHRLVHVVQQIGVVQVVQAGMQVLLRVALVCNAAQRHQLGDAQREAHALQHRNGLFIQFCSPAEFQHSPASSLVGFI